MLIPINKSITFCDSLNYSGFNFFKKIISFIKSSLSKSLSMLCFIENGLENKNYFFYFFIDFRNTKLYKGYHLDRMSSEEFSLDFLNTP